MTIKEMFQKVEGFNEVSRHLNGEKAVLKFDDGTPGSDEEVTDYKAFVKYIKSEYIPEVAEPILSYKCYEFEKPYEFSVKMPFDYTSNNRVTFYVGYAW